MKYIHGFKKDELIKLGISHDQSLILDYLLRFMQSGKMTTTIHNGDMYYWVKYDKVVEDLDILGIKKQALSDMIIYDLCEKPKDWESRLNSMSESTRKKRSKSKFIGLFKRYTKKDSEGTYSFYAPTNKLLNLKAPITDNDEGMFIEKKKAPALTEAKEITESNKSICNNKENYTCNTGKSEVEKTVKAIDILRENNIAIAKKDIDTINNTCTDLDKLRKAIEKLKASKSFGVMATINAYNSIGKEASKKTSNERPCEFINNFKDLSPNKEKNIIRDGYMQRNNLDNDIESSPQTKTENDSFRPGTKSYEKALALGICDIHGNKIK